MNWDWACERLLKGYKVTNRNWDRKAYIYMSITDNGRVVYLHHIKLGDKPYVLNEGEMLSSDWELYQEPKKWTEEDIRKAKAGIELGFEWVTRDKTDEIFFFADKPSKLGEFWEYAIYDKRISINTNLFSCVRWEDEEPTRLQDIVDSEVEE